MNIQNRLLCILLLTSAFILGKVNITQQSLNSNTQQISICFTLKPGELLYKEYLDISVDHPAIKLSKWKSDKEITTQFDPTFKETKKGFIEDVTLTIEATKQTDEPIDDAHIHVTYYSNQKKHPIIQIEPIHFQEQGQNEAHQPLTNAVSPIDRKQDTIEETWSDYFSKLVKKTESLPIRLLFVFLLGLLLSLTPCIYPMIPITVGILQAQGSKSFIHNFLVSLAYSCGMATTFALFGLLASCTGPLCGQLLMQPIFIAALVIILGYFALSMFGLYEIYIPKFLQPKNNRVVNGSFISAFIFGAASGTFASPCVSPGLVLLLSIVATMNNYLLGFLLLFIFGVGLSMPLLIVGTFSSSLAMLPKTGLWMVEIKKLFGFMMLAMCFYYLRYVIPSTTLIWFFASFIFCSGMYYVYSFGFTQSLSWQRINRWLGILLIASSVLLSYTAYRETFYKKECPPDQKVKIWFTDYKNALQKAKKENKKLFIDFWAEFCSICKAIEKNVLVNPQTLLVLENYVPVKVDGSNRHKEPYASLQKKYNITGFPTLLIVDPENETIIKKWHGEVYDDPDGFIQQLKKYK